MLTPGELQQKILKSGMDFRNREIKTFVKELQNEYEQMYKKYKDSLEQIENLNKSLKHYKSIEKTLQKALILAEKVSEEKIEEATVKSNGIKKDAQLKVDNILMGARGELLDIHDKTVKMQRDYERYRKEYMSLVKEQLERLKDDVVEVDENKWKDLLNDTKKNIEEKRRREREEEKRAAMEKKKNSSAKKNAEGVINGDKTAMAGFLGNIIKKYETEDDIEEESESKLELEEESIEPNDEDYIKAKKAYESDEDFASDEDAFDDKYEDFDDSKEEENASDGYEDVLEKELLNYMDEDTSEKDSYSADTTSYNDSTTKNNYGYDYNSNTYSANSGNVNSTNSRRSSNNYSSNSSANRANYNNAGMSNTNSTNTNTNTTSSDSYDEYYKGRYEQQYEQQYQNRNTYGNNFNEQYAQYQQQYNNRNFAQIDQRNGNSATKYGQQSEEQLGRNTQYGNGYYRSTGKRRQ